MLSLRGSIQPDPFSPAHVPQTQTQMTKRGLSEARSESSTTVVRDAILPLSDQEADDDERRGGHAEEEEEDSEVDAFEQLGRTGDRAVRMEAQRRAEGVMEAEEDGGERKKKRRKDGKRDEEVGAKKKGKHKRSKSSA
jgi:DNA-directed RNA polymerase I subunit RPA43